MFSIRRSSVQIKQDLTLHHGVAFSETKDSLCQPMSPKTFLFFNQVPKKFGFIRVKDPVQMFEIVDFTINSRNFGGFVKDILSNWEMFCVLKVLRYNKSMAITKANKVSGVSVLNRTTT